MMIKRLQLVFSSVALLFSITVSPAFAGSLEAHMTGVKVTAISSTTLTVTKDGNTFMINTDTNTQVIRRFGDTSMLSQISVGDLINIAGVWVDGSKTTAYAKLIRDGSIQERHDAFEGTVTLVTTNGFVFQSRNRGQQTVIVRSSTKVTDRTGNTIALSQIGAGNMVNVRGLWNRTSNTITADMVRDQSIPQPSITPGKRKMMRRGR